MTPGLDSGASSQKRQEEGPEQQGVKKGSRREPLRELRTEEWGSQASAEGELGGRGVLSLALAGMKRPRAPRYHSFRGLGSRAGSSWPEGGCVWAGRGVAPARARGAGAAAPRGSSGLSTPQRVTHC